MLNNPALCQYFVHQLLEIVHNQFLQSLIYHYTNDILLANSDADTLEKIIRDMKKNICLVGYYKLLQKIQRGNYIN